MIREGLRNHFRAIACLIALGYGCKQSPVVQSADGNGQQPQTTYPYNGNGNYATTSMPYQSSFTSTTFTNDTMPPNNAPQLEATNASHRAQASLQVSGIRTKQIFQRNLQNSAQVRISTGQPARTMRYIRLQLVNDPSGNPLSTPEVFDVQLNRNPALAVNARGGAWYRVEVTYHDANGRITETGYSQPFGVGEVFVVAGQSNSTNCGSTRTRATSEMVISTDGNNWQKGDDPQIGANDASLCQGGSSWPSAGDELVRSLGVPVAFASTGYSGTSVEQWLPNASRGLYQFTLRRMQQLQNSSGFRAVLWHQGETDVYEETPGQTYANRLSQIIRQSQTDMNRVVPWVVAQAAWCRQIPDYNKPQFEGPILQAQSSMTRLFPFVFAGPNTDLLADGYRGTNCHFNEQGAIESGRAWARSIADFVQRSGQQR